MKLFLKQKKGVMFFTVDALMAGVIFTLTVVLLLSFILNTPQTIDAKYYIDGYIDYVTTTSMKELNNNYPFIYFDPNEKNQDLNIYQKVLIMKTPEHAGEYDAAKFVENFTSFVIPPHVGVEYMLDGVVIYSRPANPQDKQASIERAKIYLTNSILTFAVDEDNDLYGPNITKLSIWV